MLFMSFGADDLSGNQLLNNDAEYVVKLYSDMIYGIALSHLCKKEDAEDIMQEVFLTYFQKNKVFNDENHRKAWLIRVTLICCKRMHATNKKHQYVLIDDVDVSVQFEYEEDKYVYQAVLSLPDNLKSVIYLYYFEELSAKEIGTILKIRESAVFMRLSRGRALLKERLGSDYDL